MDGREAIVLREDPWIKLALGMMFAAGFYGLLFRHEAKVVPAGIRSESQVRAGDQLDLQAVTSLLNKAKDTKDFERLLNSENEGVNNLDLNRDGRVDYIQVRDFADGDLRVLVLSTEPRAGEVVDLATIKMKRDQEQAEKVTVEAVGAEELYGSGAVYHSSALGIGSSLLLGYLFGSQFRPWSSPYGWGAYPEGHRFFSPVPGYRYRETARRLFSDRRFQPGASGHMPQVRLPPAGRERARDALGPFRGGRRSVGPRPLPKLRRDVRGMRRGGGWGRNAPRGFGGRAR